MSIKIIKSIGIIGIGQVGSALVDYFTNTNYFSLKWIVSKHTKINIVNNYVDISKIELDKIPDAVIISASSNDIEQISKSLTSHFNKLLKGKFVIHTAGNLNKEILNDCEKMGANIVATHPFQTFYSKSKDSFNNISWGIECEENVKSVISNFIENMNGKPHFLNDFAIKNKCLYHSVGVSISNYLAGSIQFASNLADEIGIGKSFFFPPIIEQTIKNSINFDIYNDKEFPLTGPIARADLDTISKHISSQTLDSNKTIYSAFGLGLLELYYSNEKISDINYHKIKELFISIILNSSNFNNKIEDNIKNNHNAEFSLLVAGLGNPEKKYLGTKHNIGFMIVDAVMNKYQSKRKIIKNLLEYATININNKNIIVAKPLTYMNNSGEAIKKLLEMFNLNSDKLLVVVDEFDFPIGKIQLKTSIKESRHNGTASIVEHIQSSQFMRLRCGIGHNFGDNEMIDYVLSKFSDNEIPLINKMIANAIHSIEYLLDNPKGKAMSYINSGKLFNEQL